MSIKNFLPGLALFTLLIVLGCKKKTEEQPGGPILEAKNNFPDHSQDTVTRYMVYSSADYGISWQPASTGLPINLQGSFIEKAGQELVLAIDNTGLFMTENNRTSWKDISNGLAVKKINTLYVSGDEIYIGLYYEGVTMWKLKSAYWNSYNNNLPNRNVLAIIKWKDELVIGTDMGIFKSSGHLQTWTGKYVGEQVVSLQATGDTIYAGTPTGVLRSKDGGEQWSFVHQNGGIHRLATEGNLIYAFYNSGDVYLSDNGGRTWNPIDLNPQGHLPVYGFINADDNFLLSNDAGVYRSKNGGLDWKLIYPDPGKLFADFTTFDHIVYGTTRRVD